MTGSLLALAEGRDPYLRTCEDIALQDRRRTPASVLVGMEALLGRPFTFDAAAEPDAHAAPRYFTPEDDALSTPWPVGADDLAWQNAPYSPDGGGKDRWSVRAWEEHQRTGAVVCVYWPLAWDAYAVYLTVRASLMVDFAARIHHALPGGGGPKSPLQTPYRCWVLGGGLRGVVTMDPQTGEVLRQDVRGTL